MVPVRAFLVISYVHTLIWLSVQPRPHFNSCGGGGDDADGVIVGGGDGGDDDGESVFGDKLCA